MITVFTPTYNRADLLPRLYESLLLQTHTDFEWIVVDDGSTDATHELFEKWSLENAISIKYFKQINGGKHRAINKGVCLARGALFFIVDSDDFLPKTALALVLSKFNTISEYTKIAGVAGRRMYNTGVVVGNSNFTELVSNSLAIRYLHHVTGDLVEVFRTNVLKEFPFPEISNEKFCPEALVWNRIAQHHDLLFFNEGIYTTEYLEGGLTSNIVRIRMQSPIASMLMYSELSNYSIPIIQKMKAVINFWRFSFYSSFGFIKRLEMVSVLLSIIGLPLGFIMYLKDKKNTL